MCGITDLEGMSEKPPLFYINYCQRPITKEVKLIVDDQLKKKPES